MERRRFLRVFGGGGVVLGLASCASAIPIPVPRSGGAVRLDLSDHPELGAPGGSVTLRMEGDGALLYVLALDGGEIAALSPICTHQGCTVGIEGVYLVCPCHGSTYTRDGNVVRGPAPRALTRYPTRQTPDGILVIETGDE